MQNIFNDKSILAAFCMQASELCSAGLPAEDWLKTAADETENKEEKEILMKMSEAAYTGIPVWQAFDNAGIFPEYMVSMIRNGEMTGTLDGVLKDLSEHYEREYETGKAISSALLYPAMMAELILLMIAVIMLKVMPLFIKVYSGMGALFPVGVQSAMVVAGYVALIAFIAVLVTVIYSVSCEKKGKKSPVTKMLTETPKTKKLMQAEMLCSSIAAASRVGLTLEEGAAMAINLLGA